MTKREMIDVLDAYRRPGSPNYGRHFLGLPSEIVRKRNVRTLLGILGDESLPARVREYAAGALGEIGDRRAVGALIEALGEAGLRRGAAMALGRMKAREAVDALRELAPRVKAAHWALSQVAVPRTVEEAIEDLRTGQLRLIPRKLGSLPGPLHRKVEAEVVERFAEALDGGDDD
ncbi:MAG: HEAT repeat domain-containing protein, partial [Armatimonadota bacterium]